jgi:hypothetical protein
MGCVAEPYLDFTPHPGEYLERWGYLGMTFGEAAMTCHPVLSWQTVVIGDPLYRPFRLTPLQYGEMLSLAISPLTAYALVFLRFPKKDLVFILILAALMVPNQVTIIPNYLTLADVFFYDYFISRGDPIDGIKSGISPTLVGHALWIGGILAVIGISFNLGLVARVAVEWRRRGHGQRLHILVYVIFMSSFAVWVEAPEIALNTSVMLGCVALFLVFFLLNFWIKSRKELKHRSILG